MRPRPLLLLLQFLLVLMARGQDFLPFGTDNPPSLSFTENYTDTVYYDPDFEDYDTIPNTTLIIDGRASMQGVDASTFDETASFAIDINDLSVEFDFADGIRTTVNGRTTVQWDVIGTDPISFDDVKVGTAFVRWTSSEIVFHFEAGDAPDDYAIIAPDYAGTVDTLDQYPLILTLSVGDYGMEGRVAYVNGTAGLYDKTVGSGDNEQTFTDLAKVLLKGFIDSTKPDVVITSPASRQVVSENPFTFIGTCDDNVGVWSVEVQVNDGEWLPAVLDGAGGWSLENVPLVLGNNTVTARVTDQDGNVDQTGKRTFKFSETSTLTVNAMGNASGKVTGPFASPLVYVPAAPSPVRTSEQRLGTPLVITAIPGVEGVFGGWTSNKVLTPLQASSPVLKINMESNMELTAHFLTNPFLPVKGGYSGLVTTATPAGRGFFTAKLAAKGAFTGTFKIGALTLAVKGRFSNTGLYHGTVKKGGVIYTIDLTLNVSGIGAPVITGTVQGGAINATVNAALAVYNKHNHAPQAGNYHLMIPPSAGNADANYPFGIGFGSLAVNTKGVAKFVGRLGDGTPVTMGGSLSGAGGWPLFAPLYKKKGTISGLVTFDLADAAHDLSGQVDWYRPAGAKPQNMHPEGFAGQSNVIGAAWTKPAPGTMIFLTGSSGAGTFSVDAPANAADTALALDPPALLSANNILTVTPQPADPVQTVAATIIPKTGELKGSFVEAGRTLKYSGLILAPKVNAAGGFFLRGTRSGSVQVTAP